MSSLEEKIKALLEGSITITGDNLSVTHDENDNDGDDETGNENDKDTDVTADGTKNDVNVKESEELSEEDSVVAEAEKLKDIAKEEGGAPDTAKIKAGLSKGEKTAGKLSADDAGDGESGGLKDEKGGSAETAKIKAGLSKGDKASAKLSMKEHMDAMFSGEELTEEFKSKAETIFEAAVEYAAEQKVTELAEQYEQQLAEAAEQVEAKLVDQIDEYLDYVVESWVEENQVALESGIRVELVDSFIDGMKRVFAEHYVSVPEDKIEVVEEQAKQIEELTAKLEEAEEIAKESAMKAIVLECEKIVEEQAAELNAVDSEKFAELCEGIDFDTIEDFATKTQTIMETYFGSAAVSIPSDEKETTPSASMSAYVSALSQNTKF